MNNSYFAVQNTLDHQENPEESKEFLVDRQTKLTRILEALKELETSKAWGSLKKEVFSGLIDRLTNDLLRESRKSPVDALKVSHIAGQLDTAEQYDLQKMHRQFSDELVAIKKQLHG